MRLADKSIVVTGATGIAAAGARRAAAEGARVPPHRSASCLDNLCKPLPCMEPISLTVDDVTYKQLAGTIDHSLLKPMLTTDDVIAGCS